MPHLAELITSLHNLRVCGLMAMAPFDADESQLDWLFDRVHEIFQDIRSERSVSPDFCHLSMGMSRDFEIAIRHGATMVRVGTALFEGLPDTMESSEPD